MKITPENYSEKVKKITNGEYETVSDYKKCMEKMIFKHNICGNEFLMKPNDFNNGNRCPHCFKNEKLTTTSYGKKVSELHDKTYELVSEYINSRTKVIILHKTCGKTFKKKPHDIITNKSKCPYCASNSRKTIEYISEKIKTMTNGEYLVTDTKYISNKVPILIKHIKCGKEFKIPSLHFIVHHSRCPYCFGSKYKGEEKIKAFLDSKKIKYTSQKEYADLIDIRPLRFDIFLEDYNVLIEYDGEQHEKPIQFGGCSLETAIKEHEQLKYHDNMKNEYCKLHNIPLIRINYKDFDIIDDLLINEFSALGINF